MSIPNMRSIFFIIFFSLSSLAFSQDWTIYDTNNSSISYDQISVLLSDNDRLWVGTNYGLNRFENGIWTSFLPSNSGIGDTQIKSLAIDQNGHLLVGTFLSGLYVYNGTTWLNYNINNSGLADNYIRAIQVENDNTYWIGTSGGLYQFDGSNWTSFDMNSSALKSDNIVSLKLDDSDTLWIGTINGGLSELDVQSLAMNTYTLSNSLINDNTILDISVDQSNNKVLSSPAGGLIYLSELGNWFAQIILNSPLSSNSLNATALLENKTFIATQDEGLDIQQSSTWLNYNTLNSPLPQNNLTALSLQGDSILWIGTQAMGLVKLGLDFINPVKTPPSTIKIKLFPNPSNQNIHIETCGSYHWVLYDIQGKIIKEGNAENDTSIQAEVLNSGNYFLQLKFEKYTKTVKVFIQQ